MDYYRILGIDRSCGADAIHQAFRNLSKTHHPDRFREQDRAKAEKEYQEIVKAYNTLKDPVQRQKYDSTLSQPTQAPAISTEQQFQQFYKAGMSRYQQRQYDAAAEYLAKAVFYKDHAESYFYKGMAEYQVPAKRKNALQSLQKAVELDQFSGKYAKSFAKILRELGMTTRAKNMVLKALELLPEDTELREWRDELDPSQKKGFLGGLFSKLKGD
ncbi:MAG: J domain-containing protein [Acidobacteria bacterium]|nr:J domain-containing protein [Acidobacteriota bacterium]MCB9396926.1 J domain-containing protein [Acidobacteriota bacterium]